MSAKELGLAPASPAETIVFGVHMPGLVENDYDAETVAAWMLALHAAGIRRICSLANAEEIERYDVVVDVAYFKMFGRDNVYSDESIEESELIDADRLLDAFSFLEESERLKLPVAVYCAEQEFRSLQLLALWLMVKHNTPAAEAIATVRASGRVPKAGFTGGLPNDRELAGHLEEMKVEWTTKQGKF